MSPRHEERRKRESTEKKKKKKKSRKPHHSPSPSSSSSFPSSDNDSMSEHEQHKKRKHRASSSPSSSSSTCSLPSDAEYHRRKRRTRRKEREKDPKSSSRSSRTSSRKRRAHEVDGSPSPEEIVSTMVSKFPDLANDLEQLLKMLDDGQAVDLTGLTDEHIAAYLKQLFGALVLHKTTQGLYFLPNNASKKTMEVLGPVLRSVAEVPAPAQAPDKDTHHAEGLRCAEKDSEEAANKDAVCDHDQPVPLDRKRRVLGPVMPSREELEAAASSLREAGPVLKEADDDPVMDSFIGPPPPAAVKEAESANEAERYEEVERILAPDIGNAYELLGLRVGTTAESLKKRYWKLSLLVHPDKCTHPQAHQAFTVLNQAFKDLQDPAKRSIIEQKIEEKETREEFEAEMKVKREAAQWRKLRGEPLPGDDVLLETPKVLKRDEWMTELPPERKAGAPTQQSTFFSRYGKSGRGDTSVWTDTPMDKALREKMGYLEAQQHAALAADTDSYSFGEDDHHHQAAAAAAGIMDQFNSAKRGTSLLEKHEMERSKKLKKASKKDAAVASQPAEWSGSHPWKPWDRDKDLGAGRKSVNLDKSNMAEGLSSRFSASHKERSFL